jgi:proline racemase
MMNAYFREWHWEPPAHWLRITAIDMHTGGEPLRILIAGLPPIEGTTVLDKRRHFCQYYDRLRTATMWEPRGHADMYGAVMTPSLDADFDVFFLHNEGYSTMCGHAIIALTTLAVESDALRSRLRCGGGSQVDVVFNVPAGRIHASARVENGRARDVTFRNVPSYLCIRNQEVEVHGIGRIRFDVAYGGAFYALVEASPLGLLLAPENLSSLIDCGRRIKRAVMSEFTIEHPFERELSFLYGTIFTGPAQKLGHHSRNVCVFADGEVDRSATGSGVSARAALHFARGELDHGAKITIESIVGSTMTVQVVQCVSFGPYDAIVPEVGGTAFVTGRHEFYLDPDDPLSEGFILR